MTDSLLNNNPLDNTQADDIRLQVVQTDPYAVVEPDNCRCGACKATDPVKSCAANEWTFDTKRCCGQMCPEQPRCSKPDPALCPKFPVESLNGTLNTLTSNSGVKSFRFTNAPTIECVYDKSQFNNVNNVKQWINTVGKDDQYNKKIMPYFCSKESRTNCPTGDAGCSRLIAENEEGRLCREWADQNPNLAKNAQIQFCQTNNRPECRCMNRLSDPAYQALKPYAPANDACWYKPCIKGESRWMFLPEGAENVDQQCPPGSCAKLEQVYRLPNTNVTREDIANTTNCFPNDNNTRSGTNAGIWILLIILFIIIIAVLYLLYRNNRARNVAEENIYYPQARQPRRAV